MNPLRPIHILAGLALVLLAGMALLRMVGVNGAPDLDTRTFALDALPPHEAEALVAPYVYMDREESPGTMTATEGTLTVRETPDNLDKIARVLQEYDRRAADIRLHFQLVEAGDVPGDAGPVEAVEEQLRRLFDFDGYRLAGEAFVTVSERGEFAQTLAGTDELYEIQAQVFRAGDAGLRLHEARLHGPRGLALMTTVNIRAGQTLVLGSSNTGTNGNTLFLTVRAETEGG